MYTHSTNKKKQQQHKNGQWNGFYARSVLRVLFFQFKMFRSMHQIHTFQIGSEIAACFSILNSCILNFKHRTCVCVWHNACECVWSALFWLDSLAVVWHIDVCLIVSPSLYSHCPSFSTQPSIIYAKWRKENEKSGGILIVFAWNFNWNCNLNEKSSPIENCCAVHFRSYTQFLLKLVECTSVSIQLPSCSVFFSFSFSSSSLSQICFCIEIFWFLWYWISWCEKIYFLNHTISRSHFHVTTNMQRFHIASHCFEEHMIFTTQWSLAGDSIFPFWNNQNLLCKRFIK